MRTTTSASRLARTTRRARITRIARRDDYADMLEAVRLRFESLKNTTVFRTRASGAELWAAWLGALPADERQPHNCHACRRFIERYGGLVTIDLRGTTRPVVDIVAPGIYGAAFAAVVKRTKRDVSGVFVSSEKCWGLPMNNDAKHDCVRHHLWAAPISRYAGPVLTAGQRSAELVEDYNTLSRALAEIKHETVTTALVIAEADALDRGEKIKGRLRWLADLQARLAQVRSHDRKRNLTWLAVATAPAGFCHVRSSVVGTLLEDIASGMPFDTVKRRFDEKMHPLRYQRPTAAPSAGNVHQAEDIVEKLGIRDSLARRYARIEEITTCWTPKPASAPKTGGVFGHLLLPSSSTVLAGVHAGAMTWEKFSRTVLPNAEQMAVHIPSGHAAYTALVTAAVADSPPILQWDDENRRNPVSWYTYSAGSPASQWNLDAKIVPVTAVAEMPNMWQPGHEHHGKGVVLLLEGCRDKNDRVSLCLFPELLKSSLHSVRKTIEAYSNRECISGADQATACGLAIRDGSSRTNTIRVTSRGTVTDYVIDRWD